MSIADKIQEILQNECSICQKILYFDEIDSTNCHAKELAARGEQHGTVILAGRQNAGRGRLGKSFFSPEGGLYLSVILRPEEEIDGIMSLTACTAVAVFKALSEFGITTDIKWVNDLFLNERKLCGILCEGGFDAESGSLSYLVIGIGLNIRRNPDIPKELQKIITDIESETGNTLDKAVIAASILSHLDACLNDLTDSRILKLYTDHSYTLGKKVIVRHNGSENTALAVGFTPDFGLIVRSPDGTEDVITTGTARFLNDDQ